MVAIKDLQIGKGKRVVVLLPDSIRNYMTKFLNNDWMTENGFMSEEQCIDQSHPKLVENKDWGQGYKVKDLKLQSAYFIASTTSISSAINEMSEYSFD